jgi:hypothetical protein
VLWAAIALFAASLLILAISGCGSSSDEPRGTIAPDNLVSRSEADEHPTGGVEAAFLEYWSDLQFQSWAEVASYYDPSFRDFVGTASIMAGKKINASSYPQLKPSIVGVTRGRDLTTIKYTLQFIDGTKELASMSWRKVGGNWQIVYDSRLDAELSQVAENNVEIDQNGVLPTEADPISPDATRAGSVAAQSQARFLEQELDLRNP